MARIKIIPCNKETRRKDNFNLRSACSMLLRPLTEPNHTLWCQPWRSYTSEWQANRVRKSFPHRYRNTVRLNREEDAGDCLRSWAFQPVHIRPTCIHRRWPQATGNDSTETTRPSTATPPVNDDAATEIRFHYERGKNMHLADMLSASTTILKLKSHFARYGIPDQVISGNGPQFTSDEFINFSRTWDFEHLTSSPGNSKANGRRTQGWKQLSACWRNQSELEPTHTSPYSIIETHPRKEWQLSQAQRRMSRRTKTLLRKTQSLLLPKTINLESEKKGLQQRQQAQAKYYNRSAKDLSSLSQGNVVRMKPSNRSDKSWRKAQVTARLDERSYTVETDSGAVYRRNRQHLRKTSEPPIEPITTEPKPNRASRDEKATTTTVSTAGQRSAPHKSHPKVVTVPNSVGGQSESGRAQYTSRNMSVTRLVTLYLLLPLS